MSLNSGPVATTVSQAQHAPARSSGLPSQDASRQVSRRSHLSKAPSTAFSCWHRSLTDSSSVFPVIPGMFIPPHPTPRAPSSFAIVRWWFSQDYEAHRIECSIAGFATQLEQNRQRLRVLELESEGLELELGQALERKRQVRHQPPLPDYRQMYRNFDAALETMRTLRQVSPLHQSTRVCTCPQDAGPSYPEWLMPPKRLRWCVMAPFSLPFASTSGNNS